MDQLFYMKGYIFTEIELSKVRNVNVRKVKLSTPMWDELQA